MLNFYNTKVLVNVRMDCEELEYWYTKAPFADHPESVQGFLHEAKLTHLEEPVSMNKIRTECPRLALTTEQLYGFTHDWYKQCYIHRLLPNWKFEDWFRRYLEAVLETIVSHKQSQYQTLTENNMYSYHEVLAEGILQDKIRNIENLKEEHFIKFDGRTELTPELSWMVEDFLACRLKGIKSKYEGKLEKVIVANLRNIDYYSRIFSVIGDVSNDVPLSWLTHEQGNDKIELDNKRLEDWLIVPSKGILLFQTPFVFHDCSTNFNHIMECLRAYSAERFNRRKQL